VAFNVRNRISVALGHGANERNLNDINLLVVHHSGNPTQGAHLTSAMLENWWATGARNAMGAPNNLRGGYHEVVTHNGDVDINMQDRRQTWGASGQNWNTWHICVVGQHLGNTSNISANQLESLAQRLANKMRDLSWSANKVTNIVRHREVRNQSTSCNDIDIVALRNRVRAILGGSPVQTPTPPQTVPTNGTLRVGQTVRVRDGARWIDTNTVVPTFVIIRDNVINSITGDRIVISFNNIVLGAVRRADIIGQTSPQNITVGARVRVNNTANTWATGQQIPDWVRGQTYTVSQVNNANTQALLSGVNSWIRLQDVTLL